MKIQSAEIEFVPPPGRGTDTASLIDWLDALRVVSPGRLGEHPGGTGVGRLDSIRWG